MNWTNAYYAISVDWRKVSLLMAKAWGAAYLHADDATISNLVNNTLHPSGVMNFLDSAGVQAPQNLMQLLQEPTP